MDLITPETTPVAVRPIILLARDHRSRCQSMFLDTGGVASLLHTRPNGDGHMSSSYNLERCVPTCLGFEPQGNHLRLRITLPETPPLELTFPATVSDAMRRGATVSWHRVRTPRKFPPKLIRQKARPGRLLGFVLQEIDTPALTRIVFLRESDRDAWDSDLSSATEESPAHVDVLRVDAFLVKFNPLGPAAKFHLAAYNPHGRDLFLRDELTLNLDRESTILN